MSSSSIYFQVGTSQYRFWVEGDGRILEIAQFKISKAIDAVVDNVSYAEYLLILQGLIKLLVSP